MTTTGNRRRAWPLAAGRALAAALALWLAQPSGAAAQECADTISGGLDSSASGKLVGKQFLTFYFVIFPILPGFAIEIPVGVYHMDDGSYLYIACGG